MKVAVIGSGIAGLSVTWHLLQIPGVEVMVYDEGKSASSVSTGLLYPFPGRMAAKCWMAKEGMEASRELLDVAESALGRVVASRSGILRLPWVSWQKKKFLKRIEKDADAEWKHDGMWVESGITVYSKLYLEGLTKACARATFVRERVENLEDIRADKIVLATGSETAHFANLPLIPVKGQALLCRWGENRLPYSLISNGHITLTEDPELCFIGSSYEPEFTSRAPDKNIIPDLLAKAALFYPPAKDFEVVDVLAGVRMMPEEGYRPIVQKMNEKTWVFTGLGSRGLLYHALLGKQLVQELVGACV